LISLRIAASQSWMVLSRRPTARVLPSGVSETLRAIPSKPRRGFAAGGSAGFWAETGVAATRNTTDNTVRKNWFIEVRLGERERGWIVGILPGFSEDDHRGAFLSPSRRLRWRDILPSDSETPMICITIAQESRTLALADMLNAVQMGADLLEVRLDC